MFNFFQKPFGLDVSDYSVEIISLAGTVEKPRLLAMAGTVLEPGVVDNGIILNKEKFKNSIENMIKNPDFGSIKTKKVIFSVPESKTFIHIFKLPQGLKKQEECEFIKSQAEKTFPFPLSELFFDFRILDEVFSSEIGVKEKEVLMIATPKKIINGFLEALKNCKLQPLALSVESESLALALISNQESPVLIADIGNRTSNFSVFDKKGLRISVSFEIAGNSFTQVISEKLKISLKEAEFLKRKIGLNPQLKKGKILLILQKEIQAIIRQIREIENYFREKENKEIKKIILAGGSATLPNFSEYLSENLEKKVVIGDPWGKINIDILKNKKYFKKALQINPVLYSAAVGSALRGLNANLQKTGINLIKDF